MQVYGRGGRTLHDHLHDQAKLVAGRALWLTRWDERSWAHSVLKAAQHAWNYQWHRRWRCLDAVICASAFLERSLRATGVPCVRIPDPLPDVIPPRTIEPDRSNLRLVFCGRVEPEKGLAPFVKSVAGIEGWTLAVVGDGRELDRVRAVVTACGLDDRVVFHGRVSSRAAVEHIARADVLVLPSHCSENAPASMFEALACGTGLLVGNLGGMPEIVEESGVGLVFDPFDDTSTRLGLERAIETHLGGGVTIDATAYLASRSIEKYLDRLELLYTGGTGGMPCVC